ncbi:DUF3027 domain-containing protein [Rothia sp. ZJ932]|uniref:DUF3027 domain-containing protein n=1 Tax=Rothia sp. ZJ932 TaxID=2810516 RepID=UPI0019680AD5|nr:DUF3027 domain-containing protein [Rothia sp. ZJ932]QRZ61911.1 DUF3027 domain-containing protein [Rothia sp. ZJ932]
MSENAQTTTEALSPFDRVEGADEQPSLGEQVYRRRTTKIDDIIAHAKDVALRGILEITVENTIGSVYHMRGEEERLSTHLFECTMPGYRGWFWFATLSRVPRSKQVTVCEVGLLPGDDALLAPQWLPWSERVLPEDSQEHEDDFYAEVEDATDDVTDAEDVEDVLTDSLENADEEL